MMPRGENQSWPADLRAFGVMALLWSLYLAWQAMAGDSFGDYVSPVRAIIGGNVFYGPPAQLVLLIEAGIFWVIAVGMITARRWSLVLSLFYMSEMVISCFVFILAYMNSRAELPHVRLAIYQGPPIVLITLYLWIRSRDLIFEPVKSS